MAKNDDWQTPPELMMKLHDEFFFDREVCASYSNRALDVPYMGLDNELDALTHPWGPVGSVCYCNPPYSQKMKFVDRALQQMEKGSHRTIVMLLPADTDTRAWQDFIGPHAHEVRFLKGRLSFLLDGKKQSTARFPSAVVIFRPYNGFLWSASLRLWDWKVS